jgi:quercetin dioxygenase-like cupin family protein
LRGREVRDILHAVQYFEIKKENNMPIKIKLMLFALPLICVFSCLSLAQGMGGMATAGHNLVDMKFVTLPPLPTCAKGSIASGDPTSGSSIIVAKVAAGCVIPWHWHTPIESVMVASGVARMDMKEGKSTTLKTGAVAIMAANGIHQFTCLQACTIFIHSNVPFDIHYVDKAGTEITPAVALKAVKENPATEMK